MYLYLYLLLVMTHGDNGRCAINKVLSYARASHHRSCVRLSETLASNVVYNTALKVWVNNNEQF